MRGLEVLLAAAPVADAGDAAGGVDLDAGHLGAVEHSKVLGLEGLGNGGDRGGIFGADVAASAVAKAVVCATGAAAVRLRVDRRGWTKRLPSELSAGLH